MCFSTLAYQGFILLYSFSSSVQWKLISRCNLLFSGIDNLPIIMPCLVSKLETKLKKVEQSSPKQSQGNAYAAMDWSCYSCEWISQSDMEMRGRFHLLCPSLFTRCTNDPQELLRLCSPSLLHCSHYSATYNIRKSYWNQCYRTKPFLLSSIASGTSPSSSYVLVPRSAQGKVGRLKLTLKTTTDEWWEHVALHHGRLSLYMTVPSLMVAFFRITTTPDLM